METSTIILIVGAVMGASVVLMIPVLLLQNSRKKKEAAFAKNNASQAIVHLYSQNTLIDGQKLATLKPQSGPHGQKIVALSPGNHRIEAKYAINNRTTKMTSVDVAFGGGQTYTVAVYEYSPEQRYNYYNGDVGRAVGAAAVPELSSDAHVIVYQED